MYKLKFKETGMSATSGLIDLFEKGLLVKQGTHQSTLLHPVEMIEFRKVWTRINQVIMKDVRTRWTKYR